MSKKRKQRKSYGWLLNSKSAGEKAFVVHATHQSADDPGEPAWAMTEKMSRIRDAAWEAEVNPAAVLHAVFERIAKTPAALRASALSGMGFQHKVTILGDPEDVARVYAVAEQLRIEFGGS